MAFFTTTTTAKPRTEESAMIAAAREGDETAAYALLDRLRDEDKEEAAASFIALRQRYAIFQHAAPYWAREVGILFADYRKACALHAALSTIDPATVPVQTDDNRTTRKTTAALARGLFRRLGIPHVSFTTPRYAFAPRVDVGLPNRADYRRDDDGHVDFLRDPAYVANRAAAATVRSILAAAFPNGCGWFFS